LDEENEREQGKRVPVLSLELIEIGGVRGGIRSRWLSRADEGIKCKLFRTPYGDGKRNDEGGENWGGVPDLDAHSLGRQWEERTAGGGAGGVRRLRGDPECADRGVLSGGPLVCAGRRRMSFGERGF